MLLLHPSSINDTGEGLYSVLSSATAKRRFWTLNHKLILSNLFLLSFASEVERSQAKGICSQCLFKIT